MLSQKWQVISVKQPLIYLPPEYRFNLKAQVEDKSAEALENSRGTDPALFYLIASPQSLTRLIGVQEMNVIRN